MSIRLNKFLADRGVASRRGSDRLVAEGRVRINGRVVSEPGTQVEERDKVSVDGKPVGGRERHVYYVLNKPVGVITTLNDPQGRRTVRELLPRGARVYPVGRLDADTSGLLLLTNDGDLAHKLMHPRYGVAKTYRVRLAREPRPDQLRRHSTGVRFEKGLVSGPARARRIDPGFDAIMIELVVHEGRFRQVRKMCEAVGLEVTGLHRVGYGPVRLGPLARGMFRELSAEEVAKLRAESARAGGASARGDVPHSRPRPTPEPEPEGEDAGDEDTIEEDTIEETWVPGGGLLEDDTKGEGEQRPRRAERRPGSARARPAEWPARAGERRGDADWRPRSGRGRPQRPEGRRTPLSIERGDGTGRRPRSGAAQERVPRPGGPRSGPGSDRAPRPFGPRRSRRAGGRFAERRVEGRGGGRARRNPSRRKSS